MIEAPRKSSPVGTVRQLIFLGEFQFPDEDAASTRTLSLARIGRDLGYAVTVIGKGRLRPQDYHADVAEYRVDGVRYMTMNPGPISWFHRLTHPLQRMNLYASTLKSLDLTGVRAVVINACGSILHVPAVSAYCRRRGIPLIGDVCEWYDPRQFTGGRLNPMYTIFSLGFRRWLPRLASMIVVSDLLARRFRTVVPNVVRIAAPFDVQAMSCDDESPVDRLRLIYAGSPGRKDRLREIVLAVASLSAIERSRVELQLVGITTSELKRLLGRSARILDELASTVKAIGRVPRGQVLARLRQAHFSLLVRPNMRYANAGFPSKIAESLAAGVPVMVNYTSDLEEYLADGTASIRVDGDSSAAVAAAIRRALSLSPQALQALRGGARAKGEQLFDYRRSAEAFRTLLAHAR